MVSICGVRSVRGAGSGEGFDRSGVDQLPGYCREIFRRTGVDQRLTISDTLHDALTRLTSPAARPADPAEPTGHG
jgi:hypothetical protein